MWRIPTRYLSQLNRKLGTDVRNLIMILIFVVIVIYVWRKVDAAKRRRDEERRRRQENNNTNNRNSNENGANDNRANGLNRFQPNQNLTAQQIMENARKEFQYTRAYDRYLTDMGWKNQCVVISVDQVMDIDESNEECRFKSNEIIEILKELAKRHRLFMICCLPASIVLQLYSKTANRDQQQQSVEDKAVLSQSSFEKKVIETFKKAGILNSGLKEHRILFCTTPKGKAAMVRQLSPTLYIDSDESVLQDLYEHLTEVVQVTKQISVGGVAPTVFVTRSVEEHFKP